MKLDIFLEKAGLSQQGLEKTLTYPNVVIKLHFPTPHRLLQTWGKFRFIWVLLLFFKSSPLSVFILISFLVDGHQRELPDHVGHYLQSLTPPASCDTYQDRLEQDLELQDRQRDAECLKTAKITVRSPLPDPSPSIPIQKNVAWLDSCIVFVQTIRENGGKERFGLTDVTWHIGWLFWFYTDTLLYTEFVIVFGKIYLEETLRVIGHRVDTCLHKHPYEIKYHVCSKYCISETTPFCLENLLEFAIMVKTNSFLGEFLSAFTEEVSYYGWNEQLPTPHPSCPHHHPKKEVLCSLTDIFGTSSHHCQPLNVLVLSFWYFPLTLCPVCALSSLQHSWLPFDLISSELSLSAGSSVTT